MSSDDGGADSLYFVVINDEEQYSIWPCDKPVPAGWRQVGQPGTKAGSSRPHRGGVDRHATAESARTHGVLVVTAFTRVRRAWSLSRNARALVRRPVGSLPALDGLRALSILWVVAYHVYGMARFFLPAETFRPLATDGYLRPFGYGYLGVDVFFVISGFLIGKLLIDEKAETGGIRVGRFYWRRALRLLPAYYLVLFLYRSLPPGCDTAWANILYVNNFLPLSRQCVPWSWSLAIEEQFYLVLPWLLLLLYRMEAPARLRVFCLMGVLGLLLDFGIVAGHGLMLPFPLDHDLHMQMLDVYYGKPYFRFGALLFGVIVAHLLRTTTVIQTLHLRWRVQLAMLVVAVVGVVAVCAFPSYGVTVYPSRALSVLFIGGHHYLVAACFALLLVLALNGRGLGRAIAAFLSLRLWYPIAQLAYAAYLVHPICIVVVYTAQPPEGGLGRHALLGYLAVDVLVVFAVAAVVHLFVERPFMNLRVAVAAAPVAPVAREGGGDSARGSHALPSAARVPAQRA